MQDFSIQVDNNTFVNNNKNITDELPRNVSDKELANHNGQEDILELLDKGPLPLNENFIQVLNNEKKLSLDESNTDLINHTHDVSKSKDQPKTIIIGHQKNLPFIKGKNNSYNLQVKQDLREPIEIPKENNFDPKQEIIRPKTTQNNNQNHKQILKQIHSQKQIKSSPLKESSKKPFFIKSNKQLKQINNTYQDPSQVLLKNEYQLKNNLNKINLNSSIKHNNAPPVKHETTEPVKHKTTEQIKHETTEPVKHKTTEQIKHETTEQVKNNSLTQKIKDKIDSFNFQRKNNKKIDNYPKNHLSKIIDNSDKNINDGTHYKANNKLALKNEAIQSNHSKFNKVQKKIPTLNKNIDFSINNQLFEKVTEKRHIPQTNVPFKAAPKNKLTSVIDFSNENQTQQIQSGPIQISTKEENPFNISNILELSTTEGRKDQIIGKVGQYIMQLHNQTNQEGIGVVFHDKDLGRITLNVVKKMNNNSPLEVKIKTTQKDTKDFFQKNKTLIVNHLNDKGVQVADLKIDYTNTKMTEKNQLSDTNSNGSSFDSNLGDEKQTFHQERKEKEDSQKRQELWNLFNAYKDVA